MSPEHSLVRPDSLTAVCPQCVQNGPPTRPGGYPAPVIGARNTAYALTIPVNVILILWVWMGRAFFGAGGWFFLIFLVSVVPALAVGLTVTTVLAILQRLPKATGRLNPAQFWTLIGVWVSMICFGFFVVDFGDTKESEASAFSRLAGRAVLDTSSTLSGIFFVLTIACYFALLVLLIIGMQGRDERRRLELEQASGLSTPPWPNQQPPPGGWDGWSGGPGR